MTITQTQAREISAGIQFHGRKMDFGFEFEELPRYWYGNDAFKSTLMNALSCLFLEGERLFIDAVRDNQHLVTDERLKTQVKNFIKQEAIHGHEHHQLSEYLSKTLMVGFWWALLAISLVLMFIFRSVTWTILAALPNFLPAIALLGLLGITGIPVKPTIATIFSIALGIAFDNTVYILSRIRSYGEKKIKPETVSRAIQAEGLSCMISSFCLFCGFLIFLMSYFSLNQYFGLFLLFSISVGLIGDLLFLPAVLASLSDFRKKKV